MGAAPMEIGALVAMLAARAPELAREMFPAGRKDGAEWRVGSLAGEQGQSLAVHIRPGPRAGVWCDFASGERGDALDLVAQVLFAGDKSEACRWARRWLGLDSGDAGALATQRRQAAERASARQMADEAESRAKGGAAKRMWLAGTPILGGPADLYLAGRGIGCDRLGRAPRALRYVHNLWCEEVRMDLPAMVAAVVTGDGEHVATHRTWLEPDHAGGWRKARLEAPKKFFGRVRGGAINLWRGKSGRPLREAPDGDVVAISEGIEDGLTVALACPDWRVLAACSVGNLVTLALPPALAEVVLVVQRDGENDDVRRARALAERRWLEEGRSVKRAAPPEGHKDFNDWWQATQRVAAA